MCGGSVALLYLYFFPVRGTGRYPNSLIEDEAPAVIAQQREQACDARGSARQRDT